MNAISLLNELDHLAHWNEHERQQAHALLTQAELRWRQAGLTRGLERATEIVDGLRVHDIRGKDVRCS